MFRAGGSRRDKRCESGRLRGVAAACAGMAVAGQALAGGLGIREQSASAQGASFAGSAAGGDLSSSFWNPAAIATADYGLLTESHTALISADFDVRAESISVLPGSVLGASTTDVNDRGEIDPLVLLASSYAAWRMNDDFVLGLAINSPFGSKNKVDNQTWSGQYHFRSSELLTVNTTLMASYRVAPGLSIGAGPQIQYLSLNIKANPSGGLAPTQGSSEIDGDDIGVGYTVGVLWQPSEWTSIGLGFRSAVSHEVEGEATASRGRLTTGTFLGTVAFAPVDFRAKLETPDILTFSVRQALSTTTRLLGTVEWTNWSVLDEVDFIAASAGGPAILPVSPGQTVNILEFNWNDGWFFALGGEWDYSKSLTLRAGAAYEVSPIREAGQRKINIADSNRVWLSAGATMALTAATSVDFAYTHIFFDDAPIDSLSSSPGTATTPVRRFVGTADQDADIVALSLKTRW